MPTDAVRLALVEREVANTQQDISELRADVDALARLEQQRQGGYATLRIIALLLTISTSLLVLAQLLHLTPVTP